MVEALLLRQLVGRRLLSGNLVVLPVSGQQVAFVVENVVAEAVGTAVEAAGSTGVPAPVPPLITAATKVSVLVGSEAIPEAAAGQQQQRDLVAAAAAAASEALGCSLEDAGPLAASRAAATGIASRNITFDQLGGATRQVGVGIIVLAQAGSQVDGIFALALLYIVLEGIASSTISLDQLPPVAAAPLPLQAQALKELVVIPLQAPHLFASYNIMPPRGVLLYGPPG